MGVSIRQLRLDARAILMSYSYFSTMPREVVALEIDVLLMHVLAKTRASLIAAEDESITDAQVANFNSLIARRSKLEPIAYITGIREFFGLEFSVNPSVLIPRPETELLVEVVLNYVLERMLPCVVPGTNCTTNSCVKNKQQMPFTLVDVGVGSGAIIISIANELLGYSNSSSLDTNKAKFIGIDISQDALCVAECNARKHELLERILFIKSDGLSLLHSNMLVHDNLIIVANPPYLSKRDFVLQEVFDYEPHLALFCEDEGFEIFSKILQDLDRFSSKTCFFAIELSTKQIARGLQMLMEAGFRNVVIHSDLAGLPRVITAENQRF